MNVPLPRFTRRTAVLAALPVLVAAGASMAGPAAAVTSSGQVASPCWTYVYPQYTVIGTDCHVGVGQYGAGAGVGTYPGPNGQIFFDVVDGDYVYGVGANTQGDTIICDGHYPENCN